MSSASPDAETPARLRSGGTLLVDALRIHGVDTLFGVPGESALPVFDALRDAARGVRFIVCRHEANAAHMAEADGKLTGRPGVCIVSRGPGAMHAAVGVHTAFQDSTPFLLIIGQVPRAHRGREAFQEMDYSRAFADMAKWAADIPSADAIPEYLSRAFHIATHGRPGPVVLSVGEDVLGEMSAVLDAPAFKPVAAVPAPASMQRVHDMLQAAERPLVIVGGSGWTAQASADITAFCATNGLPVVAGFRAQDIVDNDSPVYIGDLSLGSNRALTQRVKAADLLLVVGDRLGEVTSKAYDALKVPDPDQGLIHVFPGAEELGRVYNADLPILAAPPEFAAALRTLAPLDGTGWSEWRRAGRAVYEAYQTPPAAHAGFDYAKVILHLAETLPHDAIVTNGAGNYTIWLHRFYRYRRFGTQLAPKSGCMGYGLPAAIAAKLRHPARTVVALAGDGCFQMASPDFATAVHHNLPVVVIVVNNGAYGSIRAHQERHFPGRESGTRLTNPSFADLARAYGVHGETVHADADFPAALARALAAGMPAIIEIALPPAQLTPDFVL
ncbi:thiamine pyrophosphate-dependent enzyme [Aquabacter spiritensis]|uniref:Acetolactate synthase-1/2/3 large subunit n=1 Tax=Aquabacter spiritensis TaxID=933073 RepID=A0A4R3LZF4_9HYPH|nr:thiamine pyrophosphate-dependent enzyme [Aquabacter spiritensis]TCT05686.1 acetolactate synthase-1/2/3 large subunit [Aquabacter spiritensis]